MTAISDERKSRNRTIRRKNHGRWRPILKEAVDIATRKLDTKLSVSGEQQYKNAITEINRGIGVLKAEMQKVTAEFEDNADSVEGLTAQTDVLNRRLESERDKVSALRDALSYAVRTHGEASKEAMDYQAALYKAEAQLTKTKNTIEKLNEKISEQGYGISELDEKFKVLSAEMEKLDAAYADSSDSAEALKAKNNLLGRSLELQKQKVDKLKNALVDATKRYGENSTEAMEYKVALYKAEAAATKTENAIKKNTDALETQNDVLSLAKDELGGVGDIADKLAGKFGITLPDNLKKALDSTEIFSSGTIVAMGAAATAVGLLITAEKKLMDVTKEAAEKAKETENQSLITGMSPEEIQQLEYASSIIGVSTDKISDAQKTIITNMQAAKDGGEEYIKMFSDLGINITDTTGQLRDSNEVFYEVLDALGEIENRTERDAAAMSLMGESARELNPIIAQGSSILQQYAQDAQDTSYVLSTEQVAALADVDEKYQELQLRQEAVRKQLAAEFAPTAQKVYDKFGELVTDAGEALIDSGIADSLGSILESSIDLLEPVGKLAEEILPVLGAVLKPVAGFISIIADAGDWISGLFSRDFERMGVALGAGLSEGKFSNYQQYLGYSQNMDGSYYNPETGLWEGNAFHASGTDYFRGGRTVVGENGPETVILPAGSRILTNQETRESTGGGVHIDKVVIDAKNVRDFTAAVNTFSNFRRIYRMGAKA